jgi:glycosyltransferase involved in cell wall biosynthesis
MSARLSERRARSEILSVTVAIPTYGRDRVLTGTIASVLAQRPAAAEVIVVDQTERHDDNTERQLKTWQDVGVIRWLRLSRPSIPVAMNQALLEARAPVVLFLDDDLVPEERLIWWHATAHEQRNVVAVVGQVLQPGQQPETFIVPDCGEGLGRDLGFPFNSTERRIVHNCMAGNLSVKREAALVAGGFDENFIGISYRFETEFCRQLERFGGLVLFEPNAVIRHLKAPSGGTRTYGSHLSSARPEFSVGDYYFALKEGNGLERLRYIARRMMREVRTRFHLMHPWWIPAKLVGELRGLVWALRLWTRGRRSIGGDVSDGDRSAGRVG